MELEFILAESDCVALADYHLAHSPSVRRTQRLVRFGLGAVFLAYALFQALGARDLVSGIVWLVVAGAWVAVWPYWLRRSHRRSTLRLYREGSNRSLFGKHILRVEPDGLAWTSPGSEGKQRWSGIEKLATTPSHTFLYISAVMALVVPRHSVQRGDYDAFVAAARTHVDQAAA